MSRRGFTLMEALMTVTILAVLASIALPNYQKTVEIARMRACRDVLLTIFTGEQVSLSINQGYYKDIPAINAWSTIYMDDPNVNAPPGYTFKVDGTACPCVGCTNPADPCDPAKNPPPVLAGIVTRNGTNVLTVNQTGAITCLVAPCP